MQHTAKQAYKIRQSSIDEKLRLLELRLMVNGEAAQRDPGNWCYVGNLGHVEEVLDELLQFLPAREAS